MYLYDFVFVKNYCFYSTYLPNLTASHNIILIILPALFASNTTLTSVLRILMFIFEGVVVRSDTYRQAAGVTHHYTINVVSNLNAHRFHYVIF